MRFWCQAQRMANFTCNDFSNSSNFSSNFSNFRNICEDHIYKEKKIAMLNPIQYTIISRIVQSNIQHFTSSPLLLSPLLLFFSGSRSRVVHPGAKQPVEVNQWYSVVHFKSDEFVSLRQKQIHEKKKEGKRVERRGREEMWKRKGVCRHTSCDGGSDNQNCHQDRQI